MKVDSNLISNTISSAVVQEKGQAETDAFKKKLEAAASSKDHEKLKEASQEFEAYFIQTLFKEMRKTIQDGGLTEKSQARTTFEEMLDEEMSKSISKNSGIGLADMIYDNMLRVYASNVAAESKSTAVEDMKNDKAQSGIDISG